VGTRKYLAVMPMTDDERARLLALELRCAQELENLTLEKRPWELIRDCKVFLAALEQAHAKTVAMFGSTMARQAADYMAECLLAGGDTMKCPKCGCECERDEVDNGVGMEAWRWGCPDCQWFEQKREDKAPLPSPASPPQEEP
jgi:hypothetical protein